VRFSLAGPHQYVWIGLHDFQEEGEWVWFTSHKPATPSFWNPGEPEDKAGEEDCGGIVDGGWFDTNCEDWHNVFICETE
jgi:C-type mannose receptor